jgi:malonate decarboxylase epsilon subunit
MAVLFCFPGQGGQKPGMLHALPDHPEVRRTLQQAGDALGTDPLLFDTQQALSSTVAVQLCLLVAGVAMARVLAAHGAVPGMVAGLSIGAFPAAVVAGIMEYDDAVRLVHRRARLMESAYPSGYGLAAIVGLDQRRVEQLVAQAHSAAMPVYLANLNGPRQFVLAGSDAALAAVMELARDAGATRCERLAVSVPSHCPLLDDAAAAMRQEFGTVTLRRPKLAYLSSNAARALHDPAAIADDLANNMARQVHWSVTARLAWERGARLALEMPGGGVLTGLNMPVFDGGLALACDANRVDTVLELLAREAGGGLA